jgi:hypothetical protein
MTGWILAENCHEGSTITRERDGGRRRSRDVVVPGAAANHRGEDYHTHAREMARALGLL